MKSLSQIREASGGKEAYQKFFNSILKKFGVDSPSELEGDAKKKFYDAIDKGWESDDPNDKNETYTDPDNLDPETTVNADEDDLATGKALGESSKDYAASLNKIANDKKLNSISKADKATLAKIAKLLQSEGKDWDSGEYELDEATESLDEKYAKSMGYMSTDKAINTLYASLKPGSNLEKSISSSTDSVKSEFKKMNKLMEKIVDLWDEVGQTIEMNEGTESLDEDTLTALTEGKELTPKQEKEVAAYRKSHPECFDDEGNYKENVGEGKFLKSIPVHNGNKDKKKKKKEDVEEAVSVDRRSVGFKEALKRQKMAKEKREAAKIKSAKEQAKTDMANIGANHAYDSSVESILAAANSKIMGEEAPNVVSSGAVDMNPTGKNKKDKKESPMAKYGY